jgi:hypothetical protein
VVGADGSKCHRYCLLFIVCAQHESVYHQCHAASLAKIVYDVKPFPTTSSRFNAFAKFIVYQPGTATREPYYSKLDVPILYYRWQGEKDVTKLFCG